MITRADILRITPGEPDVDVQLHDINAFNEERDRLLSFGDTSPVEYDPGIVDFEWYIGKEEFSIFSRYTPRTREGEVIHEEGSEPPFAYMMTVNIEDREKKLGFIEGVIYDEEQLIQIVSLAFEEAPWERWKEIPGVKFSDEELILGEDD